MATFRFMYLYRRLLLEGLPGTTVPGTEICIGVVQE